VATTWLISFEQIRQHDPLAAEYLSFMSCLESKMILQSLLPDARSRKQMLEAIVTLTAYSFNAKTSDGRFYNTHRLMHRASRNGLKERRMLVGCATNVLTRLTNVFPDDSVTNRKLCSICLPHALFILTSRLFAQGAVEEVTLQ
jgi:hypothetical protein